MNKIVTLSGWGMAHDSLRCVSPEDAIHFDYSNCKNINEFFESIKVQDPDIVVGWSLGGQLALRAISEGILKPRTLILLATPYQFVAGKEIKCAMDRDSFNLFYKNFECEPLRTLKRFVAIVSLNDAHMYQIIAKLRQDISSENIIRWLYWLEQLENFSCNSLDFSKIPKTFAFHGRDDTIVDSIQTGLFKSLIAEYNVEIFDSCGHAPHLHNEARVRKIIKAYL